MWEGNPIKTAPPAVVQVRHGTESNCVNVSALYGNDKTRTHKTVKRLGVKIGTLLSCDLINKHCKLKSRLHLLTLCYYFKTHSTDKFSYL